MASDLENEPDTMREDGISGDAPRQPAQAFGFKRLPRGKREPKIKMLMDQHPDTYAQILMFIERGCYDYVAAEALGITATTWYGWIKRGAQEHTGPYRRFYDDVMSAKSRSRLIAEMEVRRDDPKFWLTHGPGKSKPGRPGWTETIAISGDEELPLLPQDHLTLTVEQQHAQIQDLAKTLLVMEQLGFIQRTQLLGQSIIDASQHAGPVLNIESSLSEDDDDDDDDPATPSDPGYLPEFYKEPGNGNGQKDPQ